jgi:hypothetical protein
VAVEADGQAAHPDAARWSDAARNNAAAAGGVVTLRYPYSDLAARPCEVAAEVAAVLRRRGWDGLPRACRSSCPVTAVRAGGVPVTAGRYRDR